MSSVARSEHALSPARACSFLLLACLLPGTPALAQGVGPSAGPFRAGPPPPDRHRGFLQVDLKGGLAPSERIVGLNQFNTGSPKLDFLGARYYLEGRATLGLAFDTRCSSIGASATEKASPGPARSNNTS